MSKLTHFRLCPFSRSIRVLLGELDMPVELVEEKPWEWRPQFLALNPSGDLPVLELDDGLVLAGAYPISEYVGEVARRAPPDERVLDPFPGELEDRAEVRRLVDWFHRKLDGEVTRELLREKLWPRMRPEQADQSPDPELMRALRANLRYHLSYVSYLVDQRRWLAGDEMSFADIAAAAHMSAIDYLNEISWDEHPAARQWYVRLKSRPSFRPLLADRVPGVPPPLHYADPDFEASARDQGSLVMTTRSTPDLDQLVRDEAEAAGFDAVGFARLSNFGDEPGRRLDAFLADERHGDMAWMATHAERRRHPQALWPQARTAIMLGMSYAPESDPLAVLAERSRGAISVYADRRDYHDVVKPALKRVARALQTASGADVKVFVDTAPLMEKPLAALAGLGWQGRHTNLVSRELGSWFFLGAILTTAEIAPAPRGEDRCGSCRRCLDVCPTAAFPAPYQLDARRCISYLTIEHKGPIPLELRPAMGNRIFGCDDCLAVCPWNKFARAGRAARLASRGQPEVPSLVELLQLDDAAFRARFAGTPVKRTGRDRFVRNVAIAAGNSGDHSLVAYLEPLLSDGAALVRGASVWALARLAGRERLRMLATAALAGETDADVRQEWQEALSE